MVSSYVSQQVQPSVHRRSIFVLPSIALPTVDDKVMGKRGIKVKALYIWSIISGIMSIGSFFLSAWERFPQWKNYLLVAGGFFAGLTVGILSLVLTTGINTLTSDARVGGFVLIIILIIGSFILMSFFTIKFSNHFLPILLILIFYVVFTPIVLNIYASSIREHNPLEYLTLASEYEKKNDIDNSIRCLLMYCESLALYEEDEKKQINDKITELKKMRISNYLKNNK